MKIVVLDGNIANPGDLSWDGIEQFGSLTVYEDTPHHLVVQRIGDADAVIVNKIPLREAELSACPNLRYIGLLSTGYDVIDIKAAGKLGITVCNVPGYSTAGVAQHTIALLLEICNQIGLHNASIHAGRWRDDGPWCFWEAPIVEALDKTIGLVGFGSIGQAVARIASALGMRVLATGSRPTPEGEKLATYVSLPQLLAQSDVVSLHCPLKPETKNLINAQSIASMKHGAILLNTARGGLVEDAALAEALAAGHIRAAGLDVVSREPILPENPLLKAPNCFITPHIAWAARETRARLLNLVEDNMRLFLKGTPINVVSIH
ncbi:MAG: D-2-hydroxyacid dehydrogenase [Oscillospiraceae bacterium]